MVQPVIGNIAMPVFHLLHPVYVVEGYGKMNTTSVEKETSNWP